MPCVIEAASAGVKDSTLADEAALASIFGHLLRLHDDIAAAGYVQCIAPEVLANLASTQLWLPTALRSCQNNHTPSSGETKPPVLQPSRFHLPWLHVAIARIQARLTSRSSSKYIPSRTQQPDVRSTLLPRQHQVNKLCACNACIVPSSLACLWPSMSTNAAEIDSATDTSSIHSVNSSHCCGSLGPRKGSATCHTARSTVQSGLIRQNTASCCQCHS